MGLINIPAKTEDSLGKVKTDVAPYEDPDTQVPAAQWEAVKSAIIANANAIGLGDGTTAGSLEARIRGLATPTPVTTTPYTLTASGGALVVSTLTAKTINLPTPSARTAYAPVLIVDKPDPSEAYGSWVFPITLARNGSEKIDGVAANRTLRRTLGRWLLWTDGTDWYTVECHGQRHNLAATAEPTTLDGPDLGYGIGSLWILVPDPNTPRVWLLVSDDASTPQWRELEFATLHTPASLTANHTITLTERVVRINPSGAFNLTLPSSPPTGWHFFVKDISGTCGTNNVTVVRAGSEKIENVAASYVLSADYGAWRFWFDGTDWWLL